MRWDSERDSNGPRHPGRRLRLLLACQRMLLGAALMNLIERQGHEVVGYSGDADDLVAALHGAGFDLALVEIGLALPDPAAFASRLIGSAVPLVLLAPSADCPGLSGIAASPIAGLALESESAESLWLCLAAVAAGGRWFDSAALAEFAERREAERDARLLTRRERDVARLVATGQRNRAIAGSLGISEGTVKMHLHNVYAKLGLESRTQLAMDERLRMRG
jgi:two-component system nitrate/nitrite response regulator NarP